MKETVKEIIEKYRKEGRISFQLTEIKKELPALSSISLQRALTRLTGKGQICSAWKGFYVIVPVEYQSKGIVPVIYYIDRLMNYLGKDYYVSLLNAASFYGAAHQKTQEFTVVTTPPSLRSTQKKGNKINFNNKMLILDQFTEQRKTQTGYVKISSPELTATDLIQFEAVIGGVNRAATVLSELAESCNFKKLNVQFLEYVPVAVIQRLGYLFDETLSCKKQADDLFKIAKQYAPPFHKTVLKPGKAITGCAINSKWNILINETIEIDEL
ncbi:MAG: type IV toxin-antitoxin system AbiEi family antitoxin [Prevotellaceae bacterium]|jgi:predicted transcriptional regulator of viral defense system|nr:type IV toxin-antitoxin system AbiEi family antitoxin [Prevotellaceae bacterium]